MNVDRVLSVLKKHTSGSASWYGHCVEVSAASRNLAELISEQGHQVDVEQTAVLGLLHDLGRSRGHNLRHGMEGYLLARSEGYEREGRICLVHLLKGRTLERGVELGMLTEHELRELKTRNQRWDRLTLEEKIVCVADALTSDARLATVEEKYADIRRRYGAFPHHYEDENWIQEIAAELTELMGRSPYEALKDANDDFL
ncbi:MAG: HD domain-containing protein [Anaerolineae bacterium]|nr:HD domain-containing protein [Anaerolineae bacterium]NIN95044.1 HD domain-containing protein [Anaerolineae bacterium]NIQ78083.1 HD domain-containing protein [Anaerolineae bacterium]